MISMAVVGVLYLTGAVITEANLLTCSSLLFLCIVDMVFANVTQAYVILGWTIDM